MFFLGFVTAFTHVKNMLRKKKDFMPIVQTQFADESSRITATKSTPRRNCFVNNIISKY